MSDTRQSAWKVIVSVTMESPEEAMDYLRNLIGGDLEEQVRIFALVFRLLPEQKLGRLVNSKGTGRQKTGRKNWTHRCGVE